jgi:hypothetical protein
MYGPAIEFLAMPTIDPGKLRAAAAVMIRTAP